MFLMGARLKDMTLSIFMWVVVAVPEFCSSYLFYIYWSKGISWLIPLITLSYEDGSGDRVDHILEIRSFGLALLYHLKN